MKASEMLQEEITSKRKPLWAAEEVELIKANIEANPKHLQILLSNRTQAAIKIKRNLLKIKEQGYTNAPIWSDEDLLYLEQYKDIKLDKEIAEALNRSRSSVTNMRLKIYGKRQDTNYAFWKDVEKQMLESSATQTVEEIANELGKSVAAVESQLSRLRLQNDMGHRPGQELKDAKFDPVKVQFKNRYIHQQGHIIAVLTPQGLWWIFGNSRLNGIAKDKEWRNVKIVEYNQGVRHKFKHLTTDRNETTFRVKHQGETVITITAEGITLHGIIENWERLWK